MGFPYRLHIVLFALALSWAGHPMQAQDRTIRPNGFQKAVNTVFSPCRPVQEHWNLSKVHIRSDRLLIEGFDRGKRILSGDHPVYLQYSIYEQNCKGQRLVTETRRYRLKGRRAMIRDAKSFSEKDLPSLELLGKKRFMNIFNAPDRMDVRLDIPTPPGGDTLYKSSLIFANRGQVCKVVDMEHRRFDFGESLPALEPNFDTATAVYPPRSYAEQRTDTLALKLHFERESTEASLAGLLGAIDSLKGSGRRIRRVEARVHASIEGSPEQNRRLFEARKKEMNRALEPALDRSVPIEFTATENWKDFRKDVAETEHAFLASRPKAAVRNYVNEHTGDPLIDSLLYEERYATVRIAFQRTVRERFDTQALNDRLVERFNDLLHRIHSGRDGVRPRSLAGDIVSLQNTLYKGYMKGQVPRETIERMRTERVRWGLNGKKAELGWVWYRQLLFRYKVLGELEPLEFRKQLRKLAKKRIPKRRDEAMLLNELGRDRTRSIVRANALLTMKYDRKGIGRTKSFFLCSDDRRKNRGRRRLCRIREDNDPAQRALENIEKLADWRGSKALPEDSLEKMEAWYHLYKAHSIYPRIEAHKRAVRRHLRALNDHYEAGKRLNTPRTVGFARTMGAFGKTGKAKAILRPLVKKEDPYPPAVRSYLHFRLNTLSMEADRTQVISTFLTAKKRLSDRAFCKLFTGEPFQRVDPEYLSIPEIRSFYCANCKGVKMMGKK